MSEDIRPEEEPFKELNGLRVAKVKDGKWVYSDAFEESCAIMKKKGVSKMKQLRWAHKAQTSMATTILAYPSFRNRTNIDNLIMSYCCLDYHLERIKTPMPKHPDNLVYAVWYLNDHEPEVET